MSDPQEEGITFRLRSYLGGSGTAMPPLSRLGDALLWVLLHDAANEIDRLEAALATRAAQEPSP